MAIIGFILVGVISLWIIGTGILSIFLGLAFGGESNNEQFLFSLIIIIIGLSIGYYDVINCPFEINLK